MKCSSSNIEGLSAEIENLRTLGPEQLDQSWRDLFESDRPRRVYGDLLIKALGYRLQENAIGGLKPSTRRLLERWGRNGSERGPLAEPARTRLKAGTVLVREWHGVTHRLTVLDDGFDLHGERFRSLSEIARKITGVRWSGPLFFGLKSSAKEQRHGARVSPRFGAAPSPQIIRGRPRPGVQLLHAQREACEAFIRSQAGEGLLLIKTAYDDGGLSGGDDGTTGAAEDARGYQSGLVDVVVVYKVDRLTRSLSDFARIIDVFDARGVSFIAVTQQFNTTTSMGRLTLNVLLSFAQFEREVTGERIRDKIAASKQKGKWMGGLVPLGYDVHERRLVVNLSEAETCERFSVVTESSAASGS